MNKKSANDARNYTAKEIVNFSESFIKEFDEKGLDVLLMILGRRMSGIDAVLDRQAFEKIDQQELDELNDEYEKIEKFSEKIRGFISNKKR